MTGTTNRLIKQIILAALMVLPLITQAQVKTDAVRLTGIVLDAENRSEVPYASVRIAGTQYGTSSDNTGYFSVFMNPGDTLLFSSIGYQDAAFIMPYQVNAETYSLVQLMRKETVLLEEVVVFPWPTLKNFERAFLDTMPKQNPSEELIKEVKLELNQTLEATEKSEYYYDQMRYQHLYEINGTIPPNNFLNPIRWSNFVKDFRKRKSGKE